MSRQYAWLMLAATATLAALVPALTGRAAERVVPGDGSNVPPDVPEHREAPEDAPAEVPDLGAAAISPAAVVGFGDYVSIQVNVNANGMNIVGDAANEPSLAVDPTTPSRMAIGWRQFNTVMSNFRQSGYAFTQDAGQTWTFPGVVEPNTFSSDPVLESDADGRFYYYALQSERGPGEWACYLYASDDGGMTWPLERYAYGGDKAWMAIDRTGGIGRGNIYLKWNSQVGCCGSDNFTRSTTGGSFFMTPIQVPENPRSGTLTVDPDGRLFVAGAGGTGFAVARSTNAQNPSQTPVFELVTSVALGGVLVFSAGPNPGGLLGQVWIDADHSDGPTRGDLYLLASVDPPGLDPLDIMFSRSTDGGVTWSSPIRVNDDPPASHAWQWFGTMAVAPNGRIDAIWNDTRADFSVTSSQLYYAASDDGGLTWSASMPVSPPFNHSLGYPSQNKLGDYYDMASDNFGVSIAYAATFNSEQDVYYLRIGEFDCNQNGLPDEDDIAEQRSEDCDANGVPDECDPDCNDNSLVDACETEAGITPDCNNNHRPDECDPDFDLDQTPDACDADIDGDGVTNTSDVCDFTPLGLRAQSNGAGIGDYNRDCVINSSDVNRTMLCFLQGGPDRFIADFCSGPLDFDGDTDFDLQDIAGIFRYYGR